MKCLYVSGLHSFPEMGTCDHRWGGLCLCVLSKALLLNVLPDAPFCHPHANVCELHATQALCCLCQVGQQVHVWCHRGGVQHCLENVEAGLTVWQWGSNVVLQSARVHECVFHLLAHMTHCGM